MKDNTLMPSYMKSFACIGGECEDTCCAGWRISINKETYKKYIKSKNQKLISSISMENNETRSKSDYAYFKLNENDMKCPMLTDNSWCSVQLELGENALSPTCATYPRVLNYVSDRFELSANVSCPEITRLALFNEEGIEFDEIEHEVSENWSLNNIVNTSDVSENQHLFWPIRMFSIEIVQNRSISLCDRLIILGLFIDRVQKEVDAGNQVDIEHLITDYRNKMKNTAYVNSLDNININIELQVRFILEILQFRLQHGAMNGRYEKIFEEMKLGYGIDGVEDPAARLIESYQSNFTDYYKPYMEKMEYVLENYVVNTIFLKVFPRDMFNMFQEYTSFMVTYALLKTHLVGIAGYYKGLNDEVVLKTIQSMSRATDHFVKFIMNLLELLERNNFNSLAHIATLIKDVNLSVELR